jgi:hypothetical protein
MTPTPLLHFCDYPPFEEDLVLYLNKLEFPLPKDTSLIEFGPLVLEKFFNFSVFLLFHYYLPLEKGYPLHLNKFESPTPKDDLCQVCFKIGPVVLEKKSKM